MLLSRRRLGSSHASGCSQHFILAKVNNVQEVQAGLCFSFAVSGEWCVCTCLCVCHSSSGTYGAISRETLMWWMTFCLETWRAFLQLPFTQLHLHLLYFIRFLYSWDEADIICWVLVLQLLRTEAPAESEQEVSCLLLSLVCKLKLLHRTSDSVHPGVMHFVCSRDK